MIVPQMPAANAASRTTKSRPVTVRGETALVLAVPFPVERGLCLRPKVVAGEDPPAAAALAREIGGGSGRRADADDQDEDSYGTADAAQEPLARNVEDVG